MFCYFAGDGCWGDGARSESSAIMESKIHDGGDGIGMTIVGYRRGNGQTACGLRITCPGEIGIITWVGHSGVGAADVVIQCLAGGGDGAEAVGKGRGGCQK